MMKKSLLALALLGAFAGVAQAQSSVVIYGSVDAGLIKRSDATLQIGKRANNTLGFKGTEDLGSGLKALFQAEIRYEPDTGTIEQGAGGVQRPLFQGQTRVGLQGAFGMIRIGRGLTAYQETSTQFEPFHGLPTPSGFQTDLMVAGYTSDPLGMPGNSTNRFNNAVFYNSPEINGWQANMTLATKEANGAAAIIGKGTAANPQFPANSQASVTPYSLSGTYKSGAGAVMMAAERNAIGSRLWSLAGYVTPAPELKLMASYQRQNQDDSKLTNSMTKAWVIGANYTMGANKILAGYGQKRPDGAQTVKQYSLGYEYSLSKRTYLYADASYKKHYLNTSAGLRFLSMGINHSF